MNGIGQQAKPIQALSLSLPLIKSVDIKFGRIRDLWYCSISKPLNTKNDFYRYIYLCSTDGLDDVDLVAGLGEGECPASHHLLVPQLYWTIVFTPVNKKYSQFNSFKFLLYLYSSNPKCINHISVHTCSMYFFILQYKLK